MDYQYLCLLLFSCQYLGRNLPNESRRDLYLFQGFKGSTVEFSAVCSDGVARQQLQIFLLSSSLQNFPQPFCPTLREDPAQPSPVMRGPFGGRAGPRK